MASRGSVKKAKAAVEVPTGRRSVPRKRIFRLAKAEDGRVVDPFSVPSQAFSRQREDLDPFTTESSQGSSLLTPPYLPNNLYWIFERSDILQSSVSAYQSNIDGFGYTLKFLGMDRELRDGEEADSFLGDLGVVKTDPEAIRQKQRLEELLLYTNYKQSFSTLRKLFRSDYEVTGNGAFEIIRNTSRMIEAIYHAPIRFMRMGPLPTTPVMVSVKIRREGKLRTFERPVYFRKFAQKLSTRGKTTWFKEYGDPRVMDSATGNYIPQSSYKRAISKSGTVSHYRRVKVEDSSKPKTRANRERDIRTKASSVDYQMVPFTPASEILWIKRDFAGYPYGIPRWIACAMDALGRHYASYVNYRLIKKGGIPQVIVTVNGGTLTDESYNDLMDAFDEWATTTDTWTNVAVLESVPETVGLEDKGSAKIDIKFMSDSRKEDIMFDKYSGGSVTNVRNSFRLTPMYTGSTDDINKATAMSSMRVTEQQVFIPEREDFDEVMNWVFRDGLGITLWKYVSKGPKITGDDEFRRGFDYFAKWGALTINEAIDLANQSMGLEMSIFEDDWANYPIPIVLKLVESGQLPGLKIGDEEVKSQPVTSTDGFGQPNMGDDGKGAPLVVVPDKAAKLKALQGLNLFNEKEIEFYGKLVDFQGAWEQLGAAPKEIDESDSKL